PDFSRCSEPFSPAGAGAPGFVFSRSFSAGVGRVGAGGATAGAGAGRAGRGPPHPPAAAAGAGGPDGSSPVPLVCRIPEPAGVGCNGSLPGVGSRSFLPAGVV